MGKTKKAPKGSLNPLKADRRGIFWKIHFINPPEVEGQGLGYSIKRQDNNDATESKSSRVGI
jgi:hypothetical protein